MLGIGPRSIVSRPPLWLLLSGSAAAQEVVLNGAQTLLDGETQGLAFDFTDQSAYIVDTGTPANNYDSTGIVSNGSLVGPSGKLVYTSASNKLTLQSDGVMRYQAHNLILQSEDFATTWTRTNILAFGAGSTANATAAPNGTITADLITPDTTSGQHRMLQSVTCVNGATYVARVRVKANGYTKVAIAENNTTGFFSSFELVGDGTVLANSSAVGGITALGDGWYDLTMRSVTASTTFRMDVYILPDSYTSGNISVSWTPDGVSGVYLWGAHLYRYPANTDYIRTTDAAKYALPLEYDTSGNCLGLLVEEARTNLCLYNTQFDNAAWTPTASSVTPNNATGPDGLTSADLLYESTANTVHYISPTANITVVSGTVYTVSVYAKQSTRYRIRVGYFDATLSNGVRIDADLSAGTVGSAAADGTGSVTSSGIEDAGNGFYKIWVSGSQSTSTNGRVFISLLNDSGTLSYLGDGASGVHLWGAQIEAGSFPTSPVVTYGSASSRLADNISIATSAFPWSATVGSYFVHALIGLKINDGALLSFASGGGDYIETWDGTSNHLRIVTGGSTQDGVDAGAFTTSTVHKVACAFETNISRAVIDGGTVASGDGTSTLPTVTSLVIGSRVGATTGKGHHIKAISYVPRRKTDTELQTETT